MHTDAYSEYTNQGDHFVATWIAKRTSPLPGGSLSPLFKRIFLLLDLLFIPPRNRRREREFSIKIQVISAIARESIFFLTKISPFVRAFLRDFQSKLALRRDTFQLYSSYSDAQSRRKHRGVLKYSNFDLLLSSGQPLTYLRTLSVAFQRDLYQDLPASTPFSLKQEREQRENNRRTIRRL